MQGGEKMSESVKIADMKRLAQYRDELYKSPQLTYLFFELTDACNLSCLHCGSAAGPQNKTYLPESSAKEVMDLVAERYPPEKIMICLSGGEPLMHPKFFEIVEYAKRKGFFCGITTNGTLIDNAVAEKMAECGMDSVTISLDGLKDTHDWFRNQKGTFERARRGIENLMEVASGRIGLQVTTVVHKKNMHQLEQLYDLVCQLGVGSWRVINLEPIGRALDNQELLLDAEELKQLFAFIRKKRYSSKVKIDVTYGCSHYLTEDYERTVRDNYFICGSGIFVASVLCNGDIYSCLDIERRPELVQGNVKTDNFIDVWENKFEEFRKDRCESSQLCKNCEDRIFCRGDAAHTWDYDSNQPMLCVRNMLLKGEKV